VELPRRSTLNKASNHAKSPIAPYTRDNDDELFHSTSQPKDRRAPVNTFTANNNREQTTMLNQAIPEELRQCDTRIKRMKNLLIQAQMKVVAEPYKPHNPKFYQTMQKPQ
jgi:hypothetical protein